MNTIVALAEDSREVGERLQADRAGCDVVGHGAVPGGARAVGPPVTPSLVTHSPGSSGWWPRRVGVHAPVGSTDGLGGDSGAVCASTGGSRGRVGRRALAWRRGGDDGGRLRQPAEGLLRSR